MAFKYVEDLATVWCEWCEMELRHKNFKRALELMRRATYTPDKINRREVQPHSAQSSKCQTFLCQQLDAYSRPIASRFSCLQEVRAIAAHLKSCSLLTALSSVQSMQLRCHSCAVHAL